VIEKVQTKWNAKALTDKSLNFNKYAMEKPMNEEQKRARFEAQVYGEMGSLDIHLLPK
jgi:hypothetical protein